MPVAKSKRSRPPRAARSGPSPSGNDAEHFADFCRRLLIQSIDEWDGRPLGLEPWQMRFLEDALAYDATGSPLWKSVVFIVPRKNGKTALLAAYALYRLLTSEGQPEILLAAASDRQAGRLFDYAASFVNRSAALRKRLRVREYIGEIVREDGGGKILRMSSDPMRLHGYNPSLVICDELAQWTTPTLRRAYAALTSGGGARKAPQTFTITVAGEAAHRHDSILGRILDRAEAAPDTEREPGLLIARMTDAEMLVYNYEAPTEDPRDTAAMKLANPASWITEEYLARQAANPELSDGDVLQLHGCVWAQSERGWIDNDTWQARYKALEVPEGEDVVLGFDGSYNRDATALLGCTLAGHLFVIKTWERPDNAPAEWKIPRSEVDAEVAKAQEYYHVLELAPDPPGWHAEIEQWADAYDNVVVFETNQRTRMAAACDTFITGVNEEELTHDGNPVLARHVANAVVKETPSGNVITKEIESRKIDAAVAAVVAYDRAMWHANNAAEPLVAVV